MTTEAYNQAVTAMVFIGVGLQVAFTAAAIWTAVYLWRAMR